MRWLARLARRRPVEPGKAEEESREDPGRSREDARRGEGFDGFGRETLHCSHSLLASAFAAIVLSGACLVDPGQVRPWQVAGGLVCYAAGVPLFFALERRVHRNGRAMPILDRTGGGRFALAVMALVFCLAGEAATAGLAGWVALSALALGCAADGAWVALVAGRRGIGLWTVLRELASGERAAQQRYRLFLFGRDGR